MNNINLLTIKQTAEQLGVSIDTLRRWDKSEKLKSVRLSRGKYEHRYYKKSDIEKYLADLNVDKIALDWAKAVSQGELQSFFSCQNASIFNARLAKLEFELMKIEELNKKFSLISSIAGEIGNNSFDHNLGNWPDVPGIFFGYNLKERKIALADRGQGILKTLKRVRPDLGSHQEALRMAFTEIISGRSPESRGNGLKYVRNLVIKHGFSLFFQTGNARLRLKTGDKDLNIKTNKTNLQGCLALINF